MNDAPTCPWSDDLRVGVATERVNTARTDWASRPNAETLDALNDALDALADALLQRALNVERARRRP